MQVAGQVAGSGQPRAMEQARADVAPPPPNRPMQVALGLLIVDLVVTGVLIGFAVKGRISLIVPAVTGGVALVGLSALGTYQYRDYRAARLALLNNARPPAALASGARATVAPSQPLPSATTSGSASVPATGTPLTPAEFLKQVSASLKSRVPPGSEDQKSCEVPADYLLDTCDHYVTLLKQLEVEGFDYLPSHDGTARALEFVLGASSRNIDLDAKCTFAAAHVLYCLQRNKATLSQLLPDVRQALEIAGLSSHYVEFVAGCLFVLLPREQLEELYAIPEAPPFSVTRGGLEMLYRGQNRVKGRDLDERVALLDTAARKQETSYRETGPHHWSLEPTLRKHYARTGKPLPAVIAAAPG